MMVSMRERQLDASPGRTPCCGEPARTALCGRASRPAAASPSPPSSENRASVPLNSRAEGAGSHEGHPGSSSGGSFFSLLDEDWVDKLDENGIETYDDPQYMQYMYTYTYT